MKTLVYVDGHTEDVYIFFSLEMCYVVVTRPFKVSLVSKSVVREVIPYQKKLG